MLDAPQRIFPGTERGGKPAGKESYEARNMPLGTLVRSGTSVLGGTSVPRPDHPSRAGGMVDSQEDPDMSDSSTTAAGDCTEHRTPRTSVTEAEVEALVRGICFKTGPPRRLGVEVEWL